MKAALFLISALVLAVPTSEEDDLSFRGRVVAVDVERSLLIVKAPEPGGWVEKLFEVDEVKTEIRSTPPAELENSAPRGDVLPITLEDLVVGDEVEIRYQLVKGKNVATLIERERVRHARAYRPRIATRPGTTPRTRGA